jgi:hypothetical protein
MDIALYAWSSIASAAAHSSQLGEDDIFVPGTYSDFDSKLSASAFNFNVWRMFSINACTFL